MHELQGKGAVGIHTEDIPNRKYREILLKNGFIKEVTKGWYIAANPEEKDGETISWYSSYWDFVAVFLERKYGENWCLSADQSLLIHAGNQVIPQQLLVRSVQGNNPYMDENGRMGRFLMNAMLASGGYPWTVIPVEKRDDYMKALESASVDQNIEPFASFLGYLVKETMLGKALVAMPD